MSDKTLGKARGLNSIADPSAFRGTVGRRRKDTALDETQQTPESAISAPVEESTPPQPTPQTATPSDSATPAHTAPSRVKPDNKRKRRELSIPHDIAEALETTAINPADIVMSAYRRHGDAIYAGAGGRPVSKGRSRLRLSLTDSDFDKVIRLGEVRGWNRSETVAVLVAFELMPETMTVHPQS